MSQENVELLHRLEDAINARSIPEDLIAPGFLMVNATTALTDKTYRGRSGAQEWINDFFEAFEQRARFSIEEVVAEGSDFIVARTRIDGSGASSEAPLFLRWSSVFYCEADRLTKVVGHLRLRDALKAVGLEE